jgi:ATP-dependent Clp protease protease subunit
MLWTLNISPLLKEYELRTMPVIIRVNEFTEKSAKEFGQKMALAQTTGQEIVPILIDSYGGQVYSLLSMISDIEHSNIPVATIAQGKAMSCGAVLLTFGAPGMRFVDKNATVMIHDVSSGMRGKVEDLKADSKEADRLNNMIFGMMAKNCGKKDDTYFLRKLKRRSRADWYLTPQDCIRYKIANHIRVPKMNVNIDVKIDLE